MSPLAGLASPAPSTSATSGCAGRTQPTLGDVDQVCRKLGEAVVKVGRHRGTAVAEAGGGRPRVGWNLATCGPNMCRSWPKSVDAVLRECLRPCCAQSTPISALARRTQGGFDLCLTNFDLRSGNLRGPRSGTLIEPRRACGACLRDRGWRSVAVKSSRNPWRRKDVKWCNNAKIGQPPAPNKCTLS